MSAVHKTTAGDRIFNIAVYILTGLFSLLCIYPIYYVLIYSISDPLMAQKGVTLYPRGFSMIGYQSIFQLSAIMGAFGVSILRTVVGTVATVAACGFFAYLMTQENMPFRKFIYRMMVITMYVGGGLIPTYLLMKEIRLINTFWVYIIPSMFGAYNVILIKTYLESISRSLQESAEIDGAGHLIIFFRIIVPVAMPILATIAVFSAVGHWGSWFDSMLYVSNPKLYCVQYLLYQYLNEASALTKQLQQGNMNLNAVAMQQLTPESVKMAITMIVIIPILCVYPFMQRYFVKGLMIGAVKG